MSDTNIFFDLLSINLLEKLFSLPFEIHTTNLVIDEIKVAEQKVELEKVSNKLIIENIELPVLLDIQENCKSNLSLNDCSVYYWAKEHDAMILTGDKKLRAFSEKNNVRVKGTLFVLNEFVEKKVLEPQEAIEKLKELQGINERLPAKECEKLLKRWGSC